MATKIEWAHETWNPIVGCSKCSPGCEHCYAERMANRLAGIERKTFEDREHGDGKIDYSEMYKSGKYINVISNGRWNNSTHLNTAVLYKPFHNRKLRLIFTCSMSDLFHPNNPDKWIDRIVGVQNHANQHIYIWLTKRPERMRQYIESQHDWQITGKNVWCGVTICNQSEANKKIPILLETHARVRFISIEPMLEPVDLRTWLNLYGHIGPPCCIEKEEFHRIGGNNNYKKSLIDWVIVGGESGPGARPMHPDWVRSVRDQCAAAGVSFFFKQWGEWIPSDHDHSVRRPLLPNEVLYINNDGTFSEIGAGRQPTDVLMHKVGKKRAGRLLDGKTHNEYPRAHNVTP